ncbi:MAG: hypothetical protein DWQ08_10245 [Proteobacteria bacterium]|nr:MAG: hypothetical protein DWQ08_10245 [Pseudomonadota bacterium]
MLADAARICLIACDNGLGHVRRVVGVAGELDRRGARVTVLARSDQAARFAWDARHFETRTSSDAFRRASREACRWHERLPDLGSFDVVVSDNLPEILDCRADALLMGSFLWHLVVEGAAPEYIEASRRRFNSRRPIMIGSGLFATAELKELTRFVDVGLFAREPLPWREKKDLLLACGRSGSCEPETAEAVCSLVARGPGPFERVHVEPRMLPDTPPHWMMPADFSPGMYAGLAAAVIRPGVGTLTDAIHAQCPVYCFYETGNLEMTQNARRIADHGLGFDAGSIDRAIDEAYRNGAAPAGDRSDPDVVPGFDGASKAASYLLTIAERGPDALALVPDSDQCPGENTA